MSKLSLNGSSIARLAAILAVLLLAPLTASATVAGVHTPVHSEHAATGVYHAENVVDATPVETPPHCHLKSAQPQASAWNQAPVGSDQPLPALSLRSASTRETGLQIPAVSAWAPAVTRSRFILFGNFRS